MKPGLSFVFVIVSLSCAAISAEDEPLLCATPFEAKVADSTECETELSCFDPCDTKLECECCPCPNWDCDYCPRWSAEATAVFMRRNRPDNADVLLTIDPAAGQRLVNANEFRFGLKAGVDLRLAYHYQCDKAIALRWFGLEGNSVRQESVGPNSFILNLTNPIVPIFAPNGATVVMDQAYDLDYFDVYWWDEDWEPDDWWPGWWWPGDWEPDDWDEWDWLIPKTRLGFRFVRLKDRYTSSDFSNNGAGGVIPGPITRTVACNDMFGVNAGFDWDFDFDFWPGWWEPDDWEPDDWWDGWYDWWDDWWDGWRLNASTDISILYNDAEQVTSIENAAITGAATGTDSDVALMAELAAELVKPVGCNWELRFGFRAMWLEQVAAAPDQLFGSDPIGGTAVLDNSAGIFFYGIDVGIGGTW